MKEWESFCETLQSDGLCAHAIIRPKDEWVTRGVTLLHLPPLWQLWHRHFLWHTLWQTEHAPLCLKLTTCSRRAQVANVAQKAFKVRCALHIQVHETLSRETWKFKKVAKLLKVEGCQHCNHCDQQHGKEPIKGKSLGLGFARKQRRSFNKRGASDSCVCVQIRPVSFFSSGHQINLSSLRNNWSLHLDAVLTLTLINRTVNSEQWHWSTENSVAAERAGCLMYCSWSSGKLCVLFDYHWL